MNKHDDDQFKDWLLYYQEFPVLNDHLTLMLSQVCSTTWNSNRIKGQKAHSPKDYMPDYKKLMVTQEEKAANAMDEFRAFAARSPYITVKKEE